MQGGSRAKEVRNPLSDTVDQGGATFASDRSSFSHLSAVLMDTVVDRGESCGTLDLSAKATGFGALLERAVLVWYMLKVFIQFYSLFRRRENVGFEFCRFIDLGKS